MATKATPVDASQADQPGVTKTSTHVPGVGDLDVYVKVEKVDDITESVTDDVATLRFAVPVWVEPVEADEEKGIEAEEGYWKVANREIDLGKKNRDAFLKALEKYVGASREIQTPAVRPAASSKSAAGAGHDLAAIREWAKKAGHEVADKGRVPNKVIDAYYNATGKARPDGQQSF
jgi:hypothetical protein